MLEFMPEDKHVSFPVFGSDCLLQTRMIAMMLISSCDKCVLIE